MASNPKYRVGQEVLAVRGPGRAMEAERWNIGKKGIVVGIHKFHKSEHHYSVCFNTKDVPDNVDESCLERA